ncbi:MAG: coproporphyrinogen III oxidase, partial [Planktomarina sp.]|nr:coproporphyrinogen III oxidase [Planktomarina sp.]
MTQTFDSEKAAASAWFRQLRDDIVARFEAIEAQHEIDAPCGTF